MTFLIVDEDFPVDFATLKRVASSEFSDAAFVESRCRVLAACETRA